MRNGMMWAEKCAAAARQHGEWHAYEDAQMGWRMTTPNLRQHIRERAREDADKFNVPHTGLVDIKEKRPQRIAHEQEHRQSLWRGHRFHYERLYRRAYVKRISRYTGPHVQW